MTDRELADAAVVELKKTTVGYKNKHWAIPPEGSHWDAALDLLAQIGVVAPPPVPPPVPPPPTPAITPFAKAVYEGYADVGDVPLWRGGGEQVKADDRLRIVDDPLGKRGKVMRVEVQPGDSAVAGSGGGERADVYATTRPSSDGTPSVMLGRIAEGKVLTRSSPILLPTEFRSNASGWNVMNGDHHSGTLSPTGQAPVQWAIINSGELRLRLLGGVFNPNTGVGTWRKDYVLGTLAKNIWHDLVWSFFYSSDPTKGRIIVSIGSKTLVNEICANIYRGDQGYHKEGWYRSAQDYPTVLYRDSTLFYTAAKVEDSHAAALAALGYSWS